jgi:hypothetical protein
MFRWNVLTERDGAFVMLRFRPGAQRGGPVLFVDFCSVGNSELPLEPAQFGDSLTEGNPSQDNPVSGMIDWKLV